MVGHNFGSLKYFQKKLFCKYIYFFQIENNERDDDLVSLLHEIHSTNINGHNFRGYTVLEGSSASKEITVCCIKFYTINHMVNDIHYSVIFFVFTQQFNGEKRPVWYVFSGMGTQWAGMGNDLMQLDVFQKAIRKCSEALEPEGMNLYNILLNGSDNSFDNVLNSFVSIAAIQVWLETFEFDV